MAISYSRSNAQSNKNEIDLVDVVGLIVFPAMAGFILEVFTFSISVFGEHDLNQAIWAGHGAEISIALLLYLGAIAWIIGTNEIDGSDYEQWEVGVMVFAVVAVPMYAFVPAVESLLNVHDLFRLALWLLVSAAAVIVSYVE